jgi:hypothetical protein
MLEDVGDHLDFERPFWRGTVAAPLDPMARAAVVDIA